MIKKGLTKKTFILLAFLFIFQLSFINAVVEINLNKILSCGDGVLDVELGEQCEPPNTATCDGNCHYKDLTCVEAKNLGLLSGHIEGNKGVVKNNAFKSYKVGLAVYEKFDEIINNQIIFDYNTGIVGPGKRLNLLVDLPDCKYQIDLFCGDVLMSLNGARYGSRIIGAKNGGLEYCGEEPFCGDGILDDGEECDDGNNINGDGCDKNCDTEEEEPFCGDGIVNQFWEKCDDGNSNNYDSCRNDCSLPYCGDGIKDSGEECDDGNNANGDGCDKNCDTEEEEPECLTDMVAYWKLDEESGAIAHDSYDGYDGNLNGGTWVSGKVANSLEFDGNDYVNFGDVSELNSANRFTIMGWVKQDSNTANERIFDKVKDGNNDISIAPYGGKLYFELGNGVNSYAYWNSYSFLIPSGTWYHFAAIYDGTKGTNAEKLKLYVNGIERPLTFSGAIPSTTADLSGEDLTFSRPGNDFNGILDEVAVWGRALSQIEITSLYQESLEGIGYCEEPSEPFCGDGIINQPWEQCDDGNNINGDGCSANCDTESQKYCGDGIVNQFWEQCDDGNSNNYDSCRNDCSFSYCGDGIKDSGEECDDGNLVNGDGCDKNCDFEEIECPIEEYFGLIEPGIWFGGESRIMIEDNLYPGRVSPPGSPLIERMNNYAFEGEKIRTQVLVIDSNGIENIRDVYISTDDGIQANCRYSKEYPEDIKDFNVKINEKRKYCFNKNIMRVFICDFTVETSESMYGETYLYAEVEDNDGNIGQTHEKEYWFFNPEVVLGIDGEVTVENLRPGTSGYSDSITISNEADEGSGVLLDMFISGTDFYDSSSSGARCPTTNQLKLNRFSYYATNGYYSTDHDSEIGRDCNSEGYCEINYGKNFNDPSKFYDAYEIIQSTQKTGPYNKYYKGNILTPGSEMALTFRLDLPEPCNGDFDTGHIYFWGEAI